MGVISCRRIEASLIPNYVRVQATTKCYCSKQGTKNRGRQKGIPGMRKSLLQVQSGSKTRPLASSGGLQQHESVGNG